jgi:hypothetical protein
MILYHGSNNDFMKIALEKSRNYRDFGRGFYTTTIKEQAEEWSINMKLRRKTDSYYLYEYKYTKTPDLTVKYFPELNAEWLEMVKTNRINGGLNHNYDIVMGPVANDNTMRTITLHINGIYDVETTLRQLAFFKVNNQVSFHTQNAIESLTLTRKFKNGKEIHL